MIIGKVNLLLDWWVLDYILNLFRFFGILMMICLEIIFIPLFLLLFLPFWFILLNFMFPFNF
jgi:hypothetical protein